ncbi:6-phosphogluconate dehydrogenase [Hyphomicrobium methylovorum]|uniref:NAD(P)-binding domain-containing protein n=1 Tax=Hyphomicrobium methylovorum TaxID=84 RepID=UPI0015E67C29|nr:NAD(P)-binding domain-containing protein [Hyphomicrobium methylovorum]MBA2127104.1 6-phosphogluconate dehydrogenase [Hyphomicrobium methylovorum]
MPRDEIPIGVIGNDDVGPAIAQRLAACGYRALYAAAPGSPLVTRATRLEPVPTPAEIAFECEYALVAIEDTETLRALLIGDADHTGLGAEMKPGSVIVDLGARSPRELQAMLGLLGTRGVAVTDAAIISDVPAISEGRAKVLVGGFPDAVDQIEPILTALGRIERTGPLGSAHASAALMSYVETARTIAREEAFAIATACGINGDALARMLADDPSTPNTVDRRTARRAELARRIGLEFAVSADIIDFEAEKRARQRHENR